jgi:hypothetical protein
VAHRTLLRLLCVLVLVQLCAGTSSAAVVLAPLSPGSVIVQETSDDPNRPSPNVNLTITNTNPVNGDPYGQFYIQYFAYTSPFVTGASSAWDEWDDHTGTVCKWDADGCAGFGFSNTTYPYSEFFPGEISGWVALWEARPERGIKPGDTYSGLYISNAAPASAWVAFNGSGNIIDWSARGGGAEIPEPSTGLLLAGGILTLALLRRLTP